MLSDPQSGTTGSVRLFLDGVCVKEVSGSTADDDHDTGSKAFNIGANHEAGGTGQYYFNGWMDGVRFTKGMPRYTSGIPTDGQTLHKEYDDGRSSNVHSNTWATSSTRRYYGINTHTYCQTSEYATTANTSLLIRGDDAVTAEDGANMYGRNGMHLEFKEVGSGVQRDYNNFNTGASGLGSDTSSTEEFVDEKSIIQVYSRPNQANGSLIFINEVNQEIMYRHSEEGTTYHKETITLFGVDSNTANVSIASGGTRTY